MDHAGFSTYESLYRARDIFQVKKVIIVLVPGCDSEQAIFIGRRRLPDGECVEPGLVARCQLSAVPANYLLV